MRPTTLKPGDQVVCDGRTMTFIRRDKACCGQSPTNVFRCADYAGLYGPNDEGRCTMSDRRVVTHVSRNTTPGL